MRGRVVSLVADEPESFVTAALFRREHSDGIEDVDLAEFVGRAVPHVNVAGLQGERQVIPWNALQNSLAFLRDLYASCGSLSDFATCSGILPHPTGSRYWRRFESQTTEPAEARSTRSLHPRDTSRKGNASLGDLVDPGGSRLRPRDLGGPSSISPDLF
jgi:hypothetical protein